MAKILIVRQIDDKLVRRLKRRAARNNRSAEAEHREILKQALGVDTNASFNEVAAHFFSCHAAGESLSWCPCYCPTRAKT